MEKPAIINEIRLGHTADGNGSVAICPPPKEDISFDRKTLQGINIIHMHAVGGDMPHLEIYFSIDKESLDNKEKPSDNEKPASYEKAVIYKMGRIVFLKMLDIAGAKPPIADPHIFKPEPGQSLFSPLMLAK